MVDSAQAGEVLETLQVLVKDRGLLQLQPYEPETPQTSKASFLIARGPNNACCFVILMDIQCNSPLAKNIVKEANIVRATQIILVTSGASVNLTPSATHVFLQAQNMSPIKTINSFCSLNLVRVYVNHKLVPPHRRVHPDDVDALFAEYFTCRAELGRLQISDPVAKWYGFAVDDIVVIEREGYGTTAPSIAIERVVSCGP